MGMCPRKIGFKNGLIKEKFISFTLKLKTLTFKNGENISNYESKQKN